jgi:allantoinase
LEAGAVDFVASDHSPSPPALKCLRSGDFFKAWGGIASLQLGLPAIWTKLRRQKDSLRHLVRWMSSGPAQLAGLAKHKGALAAGYDADVVVWNPEQRFTVRPKMLEHRHKLTPYANQSLFGVVETTFLRGQMIYDRGRFLDPPRGALLRRGER